MFLKMEFKINLESKKTFFLLARINPTPLNMELTIQSKRKQILTIIIIIFKKNQIHMHLFLGLWDEEQALQNQVSIT